MSPKNKRIRILTEPCPPREIRLFAVELAHLIGFYSVAAEFPIYSPEKTDDSITFFVTPDPLGERLCEEGFCISRAGDMIGVSPGEYPEEAFRWLAEHYSELVPDLLFKRGRTPQDYESASAHFKPLRPRYERAENGLECLFETGLFLEDENMDGLPDRLNARLLMPEDPGPLGLQMLCDLAARFGMETTRLQYPLALEEDDGISPLIRLEQGGEPAVKLLRGSRAEVVICGGDQAAPLVSELVSRFPLAREEKTLLDCAVKLGAALNMADLDGQMAVLDSLGGRAAGAVCGFSPKLEQKRDVLERLWPETSFTKYMELQEVLHKDFPLAWEVDTAEALAATVIDTLKEGDKVELSASLSEDREVRRAFAGRISRAVSAKGAILEKSEVICAYKQGFSWLEEVIVPKLEGRPVARMDIFFKPFLAPGVSDWGDVDGASPSYNTGAGNPDKWFDLPLRWLQELYPVDDVIAPRLGISRDDIAMEIYEGEEDLTYEVAAFDAEGVELLREQYKAAYSERPYLSLYPEMGRVHPATGFIRMSVNGRRVLDERVQTDLESIWEQYQNEVLPYCREIAEAHCQGGVRASLQPFFARMCLDITASEPTRTLGVREDMIDSLNALHEDIYFAGLDFFKVLGLNTTGENIDAPGLFLPRIHKGQGAPSFSMTHMAQRFQRPAIELADGERLEAGTPSAVSALIRELRLKNGRLWPVFEVRGELPGLAARAASYVKLCGEGLTEMSELLADYAGLSLTAEKHEWPAALPERRPPRQDLAIEDIDMKEHELIGYEAYLEIIEQLKRVPGISVFRAGESYQGRDIYTIRLLPDLAGYVSRVKLLTMNPSEIVNGRHHANEVAATNAAFMVLRRLLTDEKYKDLGSSLNLLITPFENADGAAIHYELQKEHPNWKLHIARFNSLGKEFARDYFDTDTIHTEALVMRDLFYRWLPDIISDNHGVPSHEWEQQFSGYTSPWFKGFWLPRALLYGYYWYITDEEYRFNKRLNERWGDVIADSVRQDPEIQAWNEDWKNRFEKYAHRWMPKLFPAEYYKNMINYWVPSVYNPKHTYMSIRFPWINSVSFTAEVADETAQGDYLYLCARTHAAHVLGGIDFIKDAGCVFDRSSNREGVGLTVTARRLRPLLAD